MSCWYRCMHADGYRTYYQVNDDRNDIVGQIRGGIERINDAVKLPPEQHKHEVFQLTSRLTKLECVDNDTHLGKIAEGERSVRESEAQKSTIPLSELLVSETETKSLRSPFREPVRFRPGLDPEDDGFRVGTAGRH